MLPSDPGLIAVQLVGEVAISRVEQLILALNILLPSLNEIEITCPSLVLSLAKAGVPFEVSPRWVQHSAPRAALQFSESKLRIPALIRCDVFMI